jgi:signal transduction histidine kinase
MNVVQGQAERLSESLADDADLQANAAAIEDRAETLVALGEKAQTVRSLFDGELPTEASYDVRKLLTDVVEEFSESHPTASVTLGDVDSVSVRADSRLEKAVTELLDNAIIHNDTAVAEVTVAVATAEKKGPREWVEIEIADNGPGIPDHEQETIERGEETSLQHGTGLGLWMVYWTVSLFGGEVSIEDNSPRGTRVILSLPRASDGDSTRTAAADHH